MSNPPIFHTNSNPPHHSQITTTTFSLVERKIEFHLARKPFSGDVNFDKNFQLETLNPSVVKKENSGVNGLNGVKEGKSGRELIDEGLLGRKGFDPELSFGITFKRIGAGLENLGNTCFLNSVLQCLTYTEPLVAYLQSGRHQSSCQIAGFCALCAIQKHVSRALTATGRSLAPKDLVSNLRCISRTFRNARQEDAHEYMVQLLESMHKCCLPRGVPSESPSAYEKSLVHKIFGGRLQSQVRCMQCSYCSNKYDPFLDLSLEIAKADSLQKALGHFTAKEQLDDGARQYQCQQCKQKVRAVKQLTVHEAPFVLTIHLKRFSAHDPSHKIDKKVSFSPKLDLKPFVSGSHEGSLMYTLYGVLVHAGWSTRSGHYYCFVRTSTGMWYSLDDNRVIQVNERTVLDQKAYMLFYVRDRKIPAQKNASNFIMNGRMSSHENNLLLTLNKGLKGVGQNGSLEKHVGGEHSDNAKKETIREEKPGSDSTATTNCAVLKTATSNINAPTLQNGTEIAYCKKVAKSPPPTQSCTNSVGSLGNGTVAPNKENTLKKDALVLANMLPLSSLVRGPENKNAVAAENPSVTVADACPLGESLIFDTTVEDLVSNVKTTPASEIQLNLPNLIKENGKMEVQGGNNLLKPRKGLVKPLVVSMRLSTNVMCGSSGRFNKKKHRKNRQSILKNQNASQNILENTVSTSDSVSVASDPRYRKSDPVKKELNSRNAPNNKTIGKCNSIALSSDSMPAAGDILKCGSSNQFRGDHHKICVNSKVEKVSALRTDLKRGLEEPTVARWDGTLASTNELVSVTCESTRIGYVPDEWDEEYDRGKIKKVKSAKDVFDGTNPFQEIATSKATARVSKKSQSSSANHPYRIL